MALLNALTLTLLFVFVLVFAGLVVLQVFLAKKESLGWGLVLPALAFVAAAALSVPNFIAAFAVSFSAGAFLASLIMLLAYNVPTLVFSLMLVFQRHRLSRMRQLNAMRVQDL